MPLCGIPPIIVFMKRENKGDGIMQYQSLPDEQQE
jgi:hypothetical protein